jgi:hypothetical protein
MIGHPPAKAVGGVGGVGGVLWDTVYGDINLQNWSPKSSNERVLTHTWLSGWRWSLDFSQEAKLTIISTWIYPGPFRVANSQIDITSFSLSFLCHFFEVLDFELRALCLLGRNSITSVIPLFLSLVIFQVGSHIFATSCLDCDYPTYASFRQVPHHVQIIIWSLATFAQASLKLWSSQSLPLE